MSNVLLTEIQALKPENLSIFGHGCDLLKMYLHRLVHNYILRMYGNGFHHRNGGFLKNGFAVSRVRTAGTRSPDYSALSLNVVYNLH